MRALRSIAFLWIVFILCFTSGPLMAADANNSQEKPSDQFDIPAAASKDVNQIDYLLRVMLWDDEQSDSEQIYNYFKELAQKIHTVLSSPVNKEVKSSRLLHDEHITHYKYSISKKFSARGLFQESMVRNDLRNNDVGTSSNLATITNTSKQFYALKHVFLSSLFAAPMVWNLTGEIHSYNYVFAGTLGLFTGAISLLGASYYKIRAKHETHVKQMEKNYGSFKLDSHKLYQLIQAVLIHKLNELAGVQYLPYSAPTGFSGLYRLDQEEFWRYVVEQYHRVVLSENSTASQAVWEPGLSVAGQQVAQATETLPEHVFYLQYRMLKESLTRLVGHYVQEPKIARALFEIEKSLPNLTVAAFNALNLNEKEQLRQKVAAINKALNQLYQQNAPEGLESILRNSDERTISFIRNHFYALVSSEFMTFLESFKSTDSIQLNIANIKYLIEPNEHVGVGVALLPVTVVGELRGQKFEKNFMVSFNTTTTNEEQILVEGNWVVDFTNELSKVAADLKFEVGSSGTECVNALSGAEQGSKAEVLVVSGADQHRPQQAQARSSGR